MYPPIVNTGTKTPAGMGNVLQIAAIQNWNVQNHNQFTNNVD